MEDFLNQERNGRRMEKTLLNKKMFIVIKLFDGFIRKVSSVKDFVDK